MRTAPTPDQIRDACSSLYPYVMKAVVKERFDGEYYERYVNTYPNGKPPTVVASYAVTSSVKKFDRRCYVTLEWDSNDDKPRQFLRVDGWLIKCLVPSSSFAETLHSAELGDIVLVEGDTTFRLANKGGGEILSYTACLQCKEAEVGTKARPEIVELERLRHD